MIRLLCPAGKTERLAWLLSEKVKALLKRRASWTHLVCRQAHILLSKFTSASSEGGLPVIEKDHHAI